MRARSTLWVLALLGCDGSRAPDAGALDAALDAAASEDAALDASTDAGPGALTANAGDSLYAVVGEPARLDGSRSIGATRYQWDFGDGRGWDAPRGEPVAEVVYERPGRFRAFLTVLDDAGRRRTASVLVNVTDAIVHAPRASGSVAVWAAREEVAVVSPDSDELAVFSYAEDTLTLVRRVATGAEPRTVTVHEGRWAVACAAGDEVTLVAPDGAIARVALPRASRPHGIVSASGALFVTLGALGEVARVDGGVLVARLPAVEDARGIAELPDGRLVVSRWRSPDEGGRLVALSPDGGAREAWALAYDPRPASDTESGGVPSYLDTIAVSPTGRLAAIPSTQAGIGEGLARNGLPLTFEGTVRAAVSFLDPASGAEDFAGRRLLDNRGLASAAVFSSRGDFLYLTMRGSRTVERFDVLTGARAGTALDVGFAPQGLALAPDDRRLFVDAYLSRELVMLDVGDPGAIPRELSRARIPSVEPLSEQVLRGKILFNDAADPRLGKDSYLACAHCHLDGLADHRTWDFTDRGEGLRDTIDLVGRAGLAHGPLHWSANFDEVQDFEHDLRGAFRGHGLMADDDFFAGGRDHPLGAPKAGRSADLDALAAYVASLDRYLPSPHRAADGSLPDAAARGRAVFEAAGCGRCHAGPALTDSGFVAPGVPRLHDVGTLAPSSGQRLGAALEGIDTPTLHGLWHSAPYLHDGSARTLQDVLTTRNPDDRHGVTSGLSAAALDDLVAYLLCLDGTPDP
ncbi:MAG: PKD domain-containing protein [Sandaracinaceae bacterium]|nr:PKD domain-containing protein [Sandaracinaceae bacterium]